ncbi:potassium transport membrane protein [Thermoproteus uzoniensis 768-20]|uniref:Potassium transport membrane protein n=1 Tax=Thermoproteus uzoniensis (strain 768-20) TaxID=999630 RepID=F2L4C1_THEU7|nr:mechanosensitive ion channel domain-containing protein [Thermoproteus uzoniensis]AEA13353.1 potassium transport membrane protein [Thermoproteus uzoniensis 768-20]
MDVGIAVTLAALGASAASYLAARIGFSRLAEGLGIEPTPLFGAVSILLAAVIFLGVETLAYNVYALFLLMVLFLAFALAGLLIALRHMIEEYFTGIVVSRVHGIHIGDYVQVGKTAGYVVAMRPTALVVRDFRRNLVHIPYTKLIHEPFNLVKIEEGHEIRVYMYMPYKIDVNKLRAELGAVASEYGVENFRIDVDHIGYRGVVLAARGILRDPRREEEVRYALLDKAYSLLASKS